MLTFTLHLLLHLLLHRVLRLMCGGFQEVETVVTASITTFSTSTAANFAVAFIFGCVRVSYYTTLRQT